MQYWLVMLKKKKKKKILIGNKKKIQWDIQVKKHSRMPEPKSKTKPKQLHVIGYSSIQYLSSI